MITAIPTGPTDATRWVHALQLAGLHSDSHRAVGANHHASDGMSGCRT